MPERHKWAFKARFRANAYGWDGSKLAGGRLREAVSEIRKVAKSDGVLAADGVVDLIERIWPSLQGIDTSSGALGSAVYSTLHQLLPLLIEAPADRKTRDKWLERLWQAIQEDGVSYLSPVEDRWGELCGSAEVASGWADKILPGLLESFSKPTGSAYFSETSVCLSALLGAGRYQELLDVLARWDRPFWAYRIFGIQALLAQGRTEDAIAFAEASRGLNQINSVIDAECERILLAAGRAGEAYRRYALTATESSTGLATYRALRQKYPDRDPREILLDLARSSGEPWRWFAAAKHAGLLDLALEFARSGKVDPRTLSRASRDLLDEDATFSLEVGRLSVQYILDGFGYEITGVEVADAFHCFMAAADRLGVGPQARQEVRTMAGQAKRLNSGFAALLITKASTKSSH